MQRRGGDLSEIRHLHQLFDVRFQQRLGIRKLPGDGLGRGGADVTNTQTSQHPRQSPAFGVLNRGQKIVRGFLAHAVQLQQVIALEREHIRKMLDQTRIDQLIDEFLTHPLNVHLAPPDEPF